MKLSYIICFLLFAGYISQAQDVKSIDQSQMKTYYIVFLKKNPSRPQMDSVAAHEIQEAHLAYLTKMWKNGKIDLAGPMLDDNEIRGIAVYDTETMQEAVELATDDPAVKSGRMVVECHPWSSMKGATLK
jgi:uncharacterized protein YciI